MSISVDFSKVTGNIKVMHGKGQAPLSGLSAEYFKYLSVAYFFLGEISGAKARVHFVPAWKPFVPDFEKA